MVPHGLWRAKKKEKTSAPDDEDGGGKQTESQGSAEGKRKYRKEKPWDHEGIDHWKPVAISKDDVPSSGVLMEESSFATLFPQYREQYLKQIWPDVKSLLAENELVGELNLIEGSMTAIELLTQCFVLVQGQTVSIMGSVKGIKQAEGGLGGGHSSLWQDPELKNENWERFLPHFKNRNVKRKKKIKKAQAEEQCKQCCDHSELLEAKKKNKDVFPPQPTPRKEDPQSSN
eukprot:Skav235526  [mRNA]  locus=scaffold3067:20442:25465:+ [translate_table: standard]